MKCIHKYTLQVHPSVVIGGVSVGRCENESIPGTVVCFEHITKDTLMIMVDQLVRDYERETGHPHPHYSKP